MSGFELWINRRIDFVKRFTDAMNPFHPLKTSENILDTSNNILQVSNNFLEASNNIKNTKDDIKAELIRLFPNGDIIKTFFATLNSSISSALVPIGLTAGGLIAAWQLGDGAKQYIVEGKKGREARKTIELQYQKIDQAREKVKADLLEVAGYVDKSLEVRIDQIANQAQELLNRYATVMEEFTPDMWREKVIEPTLRDFKELESEIFNDLDKAITNVFEHLDETVMGSLEEFRQIVRGFASLDLGKYDMKVYRQRERELLLGLSGDSSIQLIIDTYGQLELEATRMMAVARRTPGLRRQVLKDFLKYGNLCEFWEDLQKKSLV